MPEGYGEGDGIEFRIDKTIARTRETQAIEREQKPSRLERLKEINILDFKTRQKIIYGSLGVLVGSLAPYHLIGEKYASLVLAVATGSVYLGSRHFLKTLKDSEKVMGDI